MAQYTSLEITRLCGRYGHKSLVRREFDTQGSAFGGRATLATHANMLCTFLVTSISVVGRLRSVGSYISTRMVTTIS